MILITGATSGIGYEFTKLYAKDKKDLVLIARNSERLEEVSNEMKNLYEVEVLCLSCDLATEIDKLIDFVKNNDIKIDEIINNAGFGLYSDFKSIPYEEYTKMFDLNIKALTHLTYFGIEYFENNNIDGKILNVGSLVGVIPFPYMTVYSGTKGYVNMFTKSLIKELKFSKSTIKLSLLMPGATKTKFAKVASAEDKLIFKMGMTQEKVAKIGYEKFKRNKKIIIVGFVNKLNLISVIVPSFILDPILKKLMT